MAGPLPKIPEVEEGGLQTVGNLELKIKIRKSLI
jgi:hypothetical protein